MKYVFLSYVSRSGSTFLSNELSRYENIYSLPEFTLFSSIFRLEKTDRKSRLNLVNLLPKDNHLDNYIHIFDIIENIILNEEQENWIKLIAENFFGVIFKPKDILILKKGDFLSLKYKTENLLGEKNVSHVALIRDPRALCHSLNSTFRIGSEETFSKGSFLWSISRIKSFAKSIEKNKNDSNFYLIKFEKLIFDLFNSINSIGIDILNSQRSSKAKLEINGAESALHKNILSPPIKEKVNKWEEGLSEIQIQYIETMLKSYLNKYDYEKKTKTNYRLRLLIFSLKEQLKYTLKWFQ